MNKILNFRPDRSRILLATAALLVPTLGLFGGWGNVTAQTMNGFDLSQAEVPLSEIHRGGPPRDGIPALNDPEFLPAGDAPWLRDDARLLLGVSGLLYNSDVLLYDRRTESLWSQIAARAISGPRRGETLEAIPIANTTWAAWRAEHPDSLVDVSGPIPNAWPASENPGSGRTHWRTGARLSIFRVSRDGPAPHRG